MTVCRYTWNLDYTNYPVERAVTIYWSPSTKGCWSTLTTLLQHSCKCYCSPSWRAFVSLRSPWLKFLQPCYGPLSTLQNHFQQPFFAALSTTLDTLQSAPQRKAPSEARPEIWRNMMEGAKRGASRQKRCGTWNNLKSFLLYIGWNIQSSLYVYKWRDRP
mgnify:CR=1 FL=1